MYRLRIEIVRTEILLAAFLAVSASIAVSSIRAHDFQNASPPQVSLDPTSLDFQNQVVGQTSQSKRITVKNSGNKPLYIDSVSSDGDNSSEFAIAKDTCTGATVASNRACIIDVTFTPSDTGERNASLKLADNAADSPQTVSLTGTGINSNDVAPF